MTLSIIVLDQSENFLQFLDPDLCTLEESISSGGLRTLSLEYMFQNLLGDSGSVGDEKLFKIGNKLWISGDVNLTDCLYVMNTDVTEDVYGENKFSVELEEVLVELNNAPLVSQIDLSKECFNAPVVNGKQEVVVDWNALNAWFGNYFNIGVVQECLSIYASRISFSGTMTLMNLLRHIEEETGNVFVTRYEKDIITNTIHRYLDFLNPINISKNWQLHLEYDFIKEPDTQGTLKYTSDGTKYTHEQDEYNWNISPETDDGNLLPWAYIPEDEEEDVTVPPTPIIYYNIDPDNVEFRITDENGNIFTSDGVVDGDGEPLVWDSNQVSFPDASNVNICLRRIGDDISVDIFERSFVATGESYKVVPTESFVTINDDPEEKIPCMVPDDSYFEIYDVNAECAVFRTCINHNIGSVHEEVLDFCRNLENIEFHTNETDTVTAVSPLLGGAEGLSRTQTVKLIEAWRDLEVEKGTVVPMIVEKITVNAKSLKKAKETLGDCNVSNNYWSRPYNPNDNINEDSNEESSYEFLRATAYWTAPYSKIKGEMHVETDKDNGVNYQDICYRPDIRDERDNVVTPKMGFTESSDEDEYAIYNQVALYLKDHETPDVSIGVDVANLRDGQFNQYDLHDKVYLKLPDSQELVTARVTKTTKEAHDIAKNKIEINNYTNLNTIKTITKPTFIEASNISFNYPKSKTLKVKLGNGEYDSDDSDDVEYLVNKLLTFTLYKVENSSSTFTGTVYTKKTRWDGYADIVLTLDPGVYDLDICFAGDELYDEAELSVRVTVGGTLPVPAEMKSKIKAKTTKKTSKSKKTIKTFWTKCGQSPDKSKVVAVAKPSASNSDMRRYNVKSNRLYKTVFKNKCPECGKKGTLVFDGGKHNKCVKSAGAHGRGYKIGVPEHEITCNHCDSDFDGVTGLEKNSGHSTRLKMVEKPVKSSNSEFAKLVKGQLFYDYEKVVISSSSNSSKSRNSKQKINATVKKKALSIVKNKTGLSAAKELTYWCARNIKYDYYRNFVRSSKTVLSRGKGNCCDQARLLAEMLDAAGCLDFFKVEYVYACCGYYRGNSVGHVYLRLTTKKTGKSRYVDPCKTSSPWGNHCNYGAPQKFTVYPSRPF